MYCTKCGKLNQPSDLKCSACGQPLENTAGNSPTTPISNYLIFAIIVTILSIFCCLSLPFGIVAILYATKVNAKLKSGDYNGALSSSKKAKIWCWVALGVGTLTFLIGIIAAIAIPQFMAARTRAHDVQTRYALQETCAVTQAFFTNSPDKSITLGDLQTGNLHTPPDVELTIEDGSAENLTIVAVNKSSGKTFMMDRDCNIQELNLGK